MRAVAQSALSTLNATDVRSMKQMAIFIN